MDLHKLKTFRTVAVLENFNQAAQTLHYAQSTVSSQIKTLEEISGHPYFLIEILHFLDIIFYYPK